MELGPLLGFLLKKIRVDKITFLDEETYNDGFNTHENASKMQLRLIYPSAVSHSYQTGKFE